MLHRRRPPSPYPPRGARRRDAARQPHEGAVLRRLLAGPAVHSGYQSIAEGIETDEHLHIALSLGATLGQGWRLGRRGQLPDAWPAFTGMPVAIATDRADPAALLSPFALRSASPKLDELDRDARYSYRGAISPGRARRCSSRSASTSSDRPSAPLSPQ